MNSEVQKEVNQEFEELVREVVDRAPELTDNQKTRLLAVLK